ncbi:hypothetical protein FRC10_003232 [Ceratobasidium sp. 414]|nr:hypothetical protein FRC10_003232 [Ceratobasidium sp. 414]
MEARCATLDEYGAAKLTTVRENIREALDTLHGADLVFEDLRSPNILVVEAADGKARRMLVDFDWCDKENVGRYPAGLNTGIGWADGEEKGGLMLKQHDVKMFEKPFGHFSLDNFRPVPLQRA